MGRDLGGVGFFVGDGCCESGGERLRWLVGEVWGVRREKMDGCWYGYRNGL